VTITRTNLKICRNDREISIDISTGDIGKGKAIPVTGRGGPYGCET
jgi:hypothetical protein